MPKFIEKITNLVEDAQGWLNQIALPIFIVSGLALLLFYATASDQNKGKYKASLIGLLVIVILFAAIVYVIPWIYNAFK